SLVVSASAERHEKIAELLGEIDVESAFRRKTTVIPLKEASADELARRLTEILGKTQRRARDDPGMAITANESTNSLLVHANETELNQVRDLVATLDAP